MGRDPGGDAYAMESQADFDRLEALNIEPVAPGRVADRFEAGETLWTVDVPSYLGPKLVVDADTSIALYRFVQLFGTPNLTERAGLTAGTDQRPRETRTWQYLFDASYEPEDGQDRELLVSVYDYKTDVSIGVSAWHDGDDAETACPEPREEPPAWMDLPEEDLLVGLVHLLRTSVEFPVKATFNDLGV